MPFQIDYTIEALNRIPDRWKLFDWDGYIPVLVLDGTVESGKALPENPRLYLWGKKHVGLYYRDGAKLVLAEKRGLALK